jgi:hypothetical protein
LHIEQRATLSPIITPQTGHLFIPDSPKNAREEGTRAKNDMPYYIPGNFKILSFLKSIFINF